MALSGIAIFPAAVWLQSSTGMADRQTLLVIFVGVIMGCILLITLGLLGTAIFAMRLKAEITKKVNQAIATATAKAQPVIQSATRVVHETAPKVRSITDDVAEITQVVRAQVNDLDSTISDATSKARSQVDRVNGMVSSTLDTTNDVVSAIERGVKVPIREVSGLLAGLKAGFEVLAGRSNGPARGSMRSATDHLSRMEDQVHVAADKMRARSAAEVDSPGVSISGSAGGRTVESAGTEFAGGGRASASSGPLTRESRGGAVRSVVEAGEQTSPVDVSGTTLSEKTEEALASGDASGYRPPSRS